MKKEVCVDISISVMKRVAITIGHRLSLAVAVLEQQGKPAQALQAKQAMRSTMDSIVELTKLLDAGVDQLVWKEK